MSQSILQSAQKIVNNFSYGKLFSGAVYTLAARIFGTCLAFITSIAISRLYGAEMLGVLAVVQSFMMISGVFSLQGTNVSILKFLPAHIAQYSLNSALQVYRKIQIIAAVSSLLIGGIVWFFLKMFSDDFIFLQNYSAYLAISAFFIIFKTFSDLTGEAVRSIRYIRLYAVMLILHNSLFFLLILFLYLFSDRHSDPFWAIIFAWLLTSSIGSICLEVIFSKRDRGGVVHYVSFDTVWRTSLPMLLTASMHFVIAQVSIFILGAYLEPEQVGYYSAAVKISTGTLFVFQAVNSIAAPKYSELYHTENIDELLVFARQTTKLVFWLTTPLLLILILFGKFFLMLFGDNFIVAYWPLVLLVGGQFITSIAGSNGYFMNMTGHQVKFKNIIFFAGLINVILCLILIPKFHLIGASVANLVSLAFWNFYTLHYIKKVFGKSIGYFPFMKL